MCCFQVSFHRSRVPLHVRRAHSEVSASELNLNVAGFLFLPLFLLLSVTRSQKSEQNFHNYVCVWKNDLSNNQIEHHMLSSHGPVCQHRCTHTHTHTHSHTHTHTHTHTQRSCWAKAIPFTLRDFFLHQTSQASGIMTRVNASDETASLPSPAKFTFHPPLPRHCP